MSGPRWSRDSAPVPVDPVHLPAVTLPGGQILEQVVRPVPRAGPILVWSPMIAGVSITLLVVLVPWQTLVRSNRSVPRTIPEETLDPPSGRHEIIRVVAIAASLLGLVLASAVYRPDPFSTGRGLDQSWPLHGYAKPLRISREGNRWLIYWSESHVVPMDPADPDSRILETVIHRTDGSVVIYEGSPGPLERLFAWPRAVVKDPTWSPLEMWWPAFGTAAIAFLTVKALRLDARHRQDDSTFWFGDEAAPGERAC